MKTTDQRDNRGERYQAADRPLHVDQSSYDPLTIARMTDHNVRGRSESQASQIGQDTRFAGLRKAMKAF